MLQSTDTLIRLSGGNKQKLLQIAQAHPELLTATVVAAMEIDKIRAAAQLEQAPQQTVMQKAFGLGAPPVPQAPPAAPAGLGATPQGMQMASAAPPPGAPAPQGPVGMAEGGLTTLPLPDDMFDEHTFASGGIVAFDGGGSTYDKLLAKAAELEAEANSGQHSDYRRDALLSQAQQLKQQARSIGIREAAPSLSSQLNNLIPDYFQTPDVVAQSIQDNEAYRARVGAINQATGRPAVLPDPGLPKFVNPQDSQLPAPQFNIATGTPRTAATKATKATTPDDDYGLPKAPEAFDQKKTFDDILAMMGPAPKATTASAEEKAKDRNYDIGMAMLSAASAGLAKGSKTFLGALGDAGEGAMPVLAESAKARRADAKEERQAQLEQERTEYGARATAAAATRAEQNTMREYGLNLVQARIKAKNDADTLALEIKKANALAGYYSKMGLDKDAAMVNRLSKALQRIAKNPNDEEAIAERDAIQQLQGRASSFAKPMTYNAARDDARTELKNQNFGAPTEEQIHTLALQILARSEAASGGGDGGGASFDSTLWGQPVKK
jgi:hypothetical protein